MENWQSIKFRDSMTRKIDYNVHRHGNNFIAQLTGEDEEKRKTKTFLASGRNQKFPFYKPLKIRSINCENFVFHHHIFTFYPTSIVDRNRCRQAEPAEKGWKRTEMISKIIHINLENESAVVNLVTKMLLLLLLYDVRF